MLGYVYLVRFHNGTAKIGFSDQPFRRLRQLTGGLAYLTHVISADRSYEVALHRRFDNQRISEHGSREYYRSHDFLAGVFDRLPPALCLECNKPFFTVLRFPTSVRGQWRCGKRDPFSPTCRVCGMKRQPQRDPVSLRRRCPAGASARPCP